MTDRPLVITQDDQVLDDLLRIAAAAGVEVMHCRDPESRASWRSAPVVLIDAALVPAAVLVRHSRRPGVVMISTLTSLLPLPSRPSDTRYIQTPI